MPKAISPDELALHRSETGCWIAIDGVVYDVTKFLTVHPAGKGVILAYAGRDVSNEFYAYHKKEILDKYGSKLRIGHLVGTESSTLPNPTEINKSTDIYTPFAETSFTRGWSSAYMKESHRLVRLGVREFVSDHVLPDLERMHEKGEDPSPELYLEMGKAGIIASRVGRSAMPFVKAMKMRLPGGISPDEFDHFHEMASVQEIYRIGSGGVSDGLGVGATIGLPPVIHFGSSELKKRIAPEILSGRRRICLAITEPGAGSDVANIKTTAVLNTAGTHYIVNGMKKWITGGYPADMYTTAVRTGKDGHEGISLILIENPTDPSQGSITKHKIKTSYSGSAGTALIIFENVLVPVGNLLGIENQGFKLIMANFNHERWYLCVVGSAFARTCVAECYRWAVHRKAFGKRLIDQPVIRYKLAEMTAMLECLESWLESLTFQLDSMGPMEQFQKLSSPIALLKFQFSRCGWKIADNAAQIFGGRAVTRTGMGRLIEGFKNEAKFTAITGGSEEVIADLAVRQAVADCDRALKKATAGAGTTYSAKL